MKAEHTRLYKHLVENPPPIQTPGCRAHELFWHGFDRPLNPGSFKGSLAHAAIMAGKAVRKKKDRVFDRQCREGSLRFLSYWKSVGGQVITVKYRNRWRYVGYTSREAKLFYRWVKMNGYGLKRVGIPATVAKAWEKYGNTPLSLKRSLPRFSLEPEKEKGSGEAPLSSPQA